MSLLDLLKDKPPLVSVGDVPWPPPVKKVVVSSSAAVPSVPFLTSSPLFAAKRTPTLREFLNPNYRDRREEENRSSISEPSNLLRVIEKCKSSSSFSKSDLDLQRSLRHKTSKELQSVSKSDEKPKTTKAQDTTKAVNEDKNLTSVLSVTLERVKKRTLPKPVFCHFTSATKKAETKNKATTNLEIISDSNVSSVTQDTLFDHDDDCSSTTRKPSQIDSLMVDEDSIRKVRKISQDYCRGIFPGEKETAIPQELASTKDGSDGKIPVEEVAAILQDLPSTQDGSDDKIPVEEVTAIPQELPSTQDGSDDKIPIEEVAAILQDLPSTQDGSDDVTLSLQAPKLNTQNNDICQISSGNVLNEQGLHLITASNAQNNYVQNKQGSTLQAFCNLQNYHSEEFFQDKVQEERELTVESDICKKHTCRIDLEEPTEEVHAGQDMILKTDICNMQNRVWEKSTNEVHKLREHYSKADVSNIQSNIKEKTADEINKKHMLNLKNDTSLCNTKFNFLKESPNILHRDTHNSFQVQGLLSLQVDTRTCTSTQRAKEKNALVDVTHKQSFSEEEHENDLKNPLSRIKSERKNYTENNMIDISKCVAVSCPKRVIQADNPMHTASVMSQNVNRRILLVRKVLNTESSESSSENECCETEINNGKEGGNQNQGFEGNPVPNVEPGTDVGNSTEEPFDLQRDLSAHTSSSDQDTVALDNLNNVHIKKTFIIANADLNSESGDTSSTDSEDQENSNLGEDEDFEVLVFKDSDDEDSDDEDGFEDGKIDEDSIDESSEPEKNIAEHTCIPDKDSLVRIKGNNDSKKTIPPVSLKSPQINKTKKTKLRNEKRVSKQSSTPVKRKKTKVNCSPNNKFKKPQEHQTSTCRSEGKSEKPMEQTQDEFSLLSTLTSSAVMDVTVAASEMELIKKKTRGGKVSERKRKKLQKRMNDYKARIAKRRQQEVRREPLPKPVCTFYLNGSCNKGDECNFRHEGTLIKKPQVCKFFIGDACRKGDNCPYQHGAYPCRYFHLGPRVCKNRDKCRFSHDAPTPDTQVLFDQLYEDEREEKKLIEQNSSSLHLISERNIPSTATDSTELCVVKDAYVQNNPYSVRYGSVQEENHEKSSKGKQENDGNIKKACVDEQDKLEPRGSSSTTMTPSYVVPGMYMQTDFKS